MKKTFLLTLLSCGLLSVFAGKPPDFDEVRHRASIRDFDRDTSEVKIDESKLNAIEKRMNAIIIPQIEFRQANIVDIINFFDVVVKDIGEGIEKSDETRIRIAIDRENTGNQTPVITFASRKMPLLYALKFTMKLGSLEYKIDNRTVTVFTPKK